jgi:hypothetical protein
MRVLAVACIALGFQFLCVAAQTYNYNDAIYKSILFYEAQRSGKLPSNNRVRWRGDSALGDKGTNGEDLTGGWYDAGDFVKFGFPQAASVTLLAWGGIEFKAAYQSAGEWNNLLASLRWPLDYFMKCHPSSNVFYGQVGDGTLDHNYWGRPEDMKMARPAWSLWSTNPGSDLAAETAAAFAAGYLLFRDTDSTYAFRLLDHARRLYNFAYTYRGFYSTAISDAANYYKSSSYTDELAWGAAWLYRATGEAAFLTRAREFASTSAVAWAMDWDEKTVGYQLILTITGQTTYSAPVQTFLRNWFRGGNVPYTPKGLAFRSQWGSNRYAANSAFIALVAAKHNILRANSITFAREQIHYMLGGHGRSLLVGFGSNPPTRPHHAAASCKDPPAACGWNDFSATTSNPQILYGALVGGPDQRDGYVDDRTNYIHNEVTCDYNAGFQGAVAGLKELG